MYNFYKKIVQLGYLNLPLTVQYAGLRNVFSNPNLHIIYVFGSIIDLPLLLQQHLKTLTIHYQSFNICEDFVKYFDVG